MNSPKSNQKLRILLVGPAQSIHVQRWVRQLTNDGHTVSLVSEFPMNDLPDGVKISLLPCKHLPRIARYILGLVTVRRHISQENPEIIQFHSLGTNAILALVAPRRKLVATPWGSDIAMVRRASLRFHLVKHVLRRSALVLTTSKQMRDDVIEKFGVEGQKVEKVSWGINRTLFYPPATIEHRNAERLRWGLPLGAYVVLSIRSTADIYRTDMIVDSFLDAASAKPDIHLVLLSGFTPSNPKARMRQISYVSAITAKMQQFGSQVTFLNRELSSDEIASILRAVDLVVSIPKWDQRSSSVLEAIASGVKVVLSDIPAYSEMKKEGARVVVLGDPLVPQLSQLIHNTSKTDSSDIEANDEFIRHNEDWFAQSRKVQSIYVDLVVRNRQHRGRTAKKGL